MSALKAVLLRRLSCHLERQLGSMAKTCDILSISGRSAYATDTKQNAETSKPDVFPFMDYFRFHNSSLPDLQKHTIRGRVCAIDKKSVYIETGLGGLVRFLKHELSTRNVVRKDGHKRLIGEKDKKKTTDSKNEVIKIGDQMDFAIERMEAYDGRMVLRPLAPESNVDMDKIWKELEAAQKDGKSFKGRILNGVKQGYAVGIGGYIAFLPQSLVPPSVAARVGILQDFEIIQMHRDAKTHSIVVRYSRKGYQ